MFSQLTNPQERPANGTRPKLLFLAHRFPPVNSSGCVRTWNIAKYLARSGWDVTVVTPDPSVWRHVEGTKGLEERIASAGIRRLLTGHRWRCLAPAILKCPDRGIGWFFGGVCRRIARGLSIDGEVGWVKPVERACSRLTAGDVDVIFATAAPYAGFDAARRLSERLGKPYVMDYRDPWSHNPHDKYPVGPAIIRRETKLLARAAAVTVVSPSWAKAMEERFHLGAKLHVVTNGYDPEEAQDVQPHAFGHFAIVYAGTFYPPKRSIVPLMAALKRFKETANGRQWYFHYYGDKSAYVRERSARYGVGDRVVLHGRVSRAEVLSAVRGAGAAVVITSVAEASSVDEEGIIPAKIFEILGLETPILLIAPARNDAATILEASGAGRRFSGADVDGIARFLAQHSADPENGARAENYSWPILALKLDRILRNVMDRESKRLFQSEVPSSFEHNSAEVQSWQ